MLAVARAEDKMLAERGVKNIHANMRRKLKARKRYGRLTKVNGPRTVGQDSEKAPGTWQM